jgi:hypothetical protein
VIAMTIGGLTAMIGVAVTKTAGASAVGNYSARNELAFVSIAT